MTEEGMEGLEEPPVRCFDPGESYLVLEPKPQVTYEIFTDLMREQYQGLIITRTFPDKIRDQYGLKVTPIVWLSVKEQSENSISPTNLGKLAWLVKEFLDKCDRGVVLLDGFEYLTINNSFDRIIKFVQEIQETIVVKSAIMLMNVSERSLDSRELALLGRDMELVD